MNTKKRAIGFYLSALAAVLGAAGVVFTVLGNNASPDNALGNISTLILAGVVGVLLAVVASAASVSLGNHNIVSAVSVLGSIALYAYLFGSSVGQRVTLIAGLFSFNAGNLAGWQVFRMSIVAWVCLIVAMVVLVVSSFVKSVKVAQSA